MKKMSLEQILHELDSNENAKRLAAAQEEYIQRNSPKSVDQFERALCDAVCQVNNRLGIDAHISFKMEDKSNGRGSIERGKVRYAYRYGNGKLSLQYATSRGTNSDDFTPSLGSPESVNENVAIVGTDGTQGIQIAGSIMWSSGRDESFSAQELATSLLHDFMQQH